MTTTVPLGTFIEVAVPPRAGNRENTVYKEAAWLVLIGCYVQIDSGGHIKYCFHLFQMCPGFRRSRKEEVVLSRLRIGHTYFSHSYILRREDPPECTACQEIYSVDCIDLGLIRPRFYSVPDMKTLFDTVSVDRIISFVREINLFSKI